MTGDTGTRLAGRLPEHRFVALDQHGRVRAHRPPAARRRAESLRTVDGPVRLMVNASRHRQASGALAAAFSSDR